MATQDEDKKLQILNAHKELESDDNLAFEMSCRALCVNDVKELATRQHRRG